MKKSLSKWYTYLIAVGLVLLAEAVAVIPFFAINNTEAWPMVYISYTSLLSGVVYAGCGFITQDIFRAFKRKETKNWDYPLEQKYLDQAWTIFMPFLIAAALLVIFGLISYPFFR